MSLLSVSMFRNGRNSLLSLCNTNDMVYRIDRNGGRLLIQNDVKADGVRHISKVGAIHGSWMNASCDNKHTEATQSSRRGRGPEVANLLTEQNCRLLRSLRNLAICDLGTVGRQTIPDSVSVSNRLEHLIERVPGTRRNDWQTQNLFAHQRIGYGTTGHRSLWNFSNFAATQNFNLSCVSSGNINLGGTRSVTYYSFQKGKRKTVKTVTRRFYRLYWGAWIRPKAGRHTKVYRKNAGMKIRALQHVFCKANQSYLLDKMVCKFWRKRKYYVDDPYETYHVRDNYFASRKYFE